MNEGSREEDISLRLTGDEALVLSAWLAGGEPVVTPSEGSAEEIVLWEIEAQLEKALVTPFLADYSAILADARRRILESVGLKVKR